MTPSGRTRPASSGSPTTLSSVTSPWIGLHPKRIDDVGETLAARRACGRRRGPAAYAVGAPRRAAPRRRRRAIAGPTAPTRSRPGMVEDGEGERRARREAPRSATSPGARWSCVRERRALDVRQQAHGQQVAADVDLVAGACPSSAGDRHGRGEAGVGRGDVEQSGVLGLDRRTAPRPVRHLEHDADRRAASTRKLRSWWLPSSLVSPTTPNKSSARRAAIVTSTSGRGETSRSRGAITVRSRRGGRGRRSSAYDAPRTRSPA